MVKKINYVNIDEQAAEEKKLNDEFNKWADSLEKLDDRSISKAIFEHVYYNSDLAKDDKELLKASYDYCCKLIDQHKPLEIDLLRIYLKDLKGYEINNVNIAMLVSVLGMCGIILTKK